MKVGILSDFRIFETNEFIKQLEKLSSTDRKFISQKLSNYIYPQLKQGPFWGINIKKLHGYNPNIWRYRIGRYRLFYMINKHEEIISILTIDARKDIYKK